jgi:hypothetical protein
MDGFNPYWNESISFELTRPELAQIIFEVYPHPRKEGGKGGRGRGRRHVGGKREKERGRSGGVKRWISIRIGTKLYRSS